MDVIPYNDALAWHWAEVMRDAHQAGGWKQGMPGSQQPQNC